MKFPFQPNQFSDLTCEELRTVTNLHLTPTVILLLLAQYSSYIHQSRLVLPSTESDPNSRQEIGLVNIHPAIIPLVESLQAISDDLEQAGKSIRKELKKKKGAADIDPRK